MLDDYRPSTNGFHEYTNELPPSVNSYIRALIRGRLTVQTPPDDNILPEIRLLDPNVPVLVLTADASMDSALVAVRTGARDYLVKPVSPAHLIARIREVLKTQDDNQKMM